MKRFTLFPLLALLSVALWLAGCGEHAHDHDHGEACEGHEQTPNAERGDHEHGEACEGNAHDEAQTPNAER